MLQFRSGVPSTAGELTGCSKGTHCAARGAGIFKRRDLGEGRLHHGGMPLTLSCFVSQHLLRSMLSPKMIPCSTSWKRATPDHRLNSRNRWVKINPPFSSVDLLKGFLPAMESWWTHLAVQQASGVYILKSSNKLLHKEPGLVVSWTQDIPIPALRRLKQGTHSEYTANLGYILNSKPF